MSGQNTTARKPTAARSKAAAARAEKKPEAKTVEWRGLTLTLPSVLPGTLYFDFAELQEDSNDVGAQVRLVRAKIAEDEIPFDQMDDVLVDLFNVAFDAYGIGMGESSASASS